MVTYVSGFRQTGVHLCARGIVRSILSGLEHYGDVSNPRRAGIPNPTVEVTLSGFIAILIAVYRRLVEPLRLRSHSIKRY